MPSDPSPPDSFDSLPTRSAAVVEGAADGLADGLERDAVAGELDAVHGALGRAGQGIRPSRSPRADRLRARLERIDERVDDVVDKTRVRARAVAESARRARHAPATVSADLRGAAKSWASGLAISVGLQAAAGVVAAVAFVVLTVGFVQALNALVGAPWGTFLVALLYGILAFALFSGAKARAKRGREEARRRLLHAGHEIRRVARPVRNAFRGVEDPPAEPSMPQTTRLKL
ncbi:MAG TPA: hypothetical protein VM327_07990 [Candidatus Thermoplasmatota archaeon]|nr:hypothetical protein [Candidatus Thermoplasmatota archaeon]